MIARLTNFARIADPGSFRRTPAFGGTILLHRLEREPEPDYRRRKKTDLPAERDESKGNIRVQSNSSREQDVQTPDRTARSHVGEPLIRGGAFVLSTRAYLVRLSEPFGVLRGSERTITARGPTAFSSPAVGHSSLLIILKFNGPSARSVWGPHFSH
jgi:hypothetical protein